MDKRGEILHEQVIFIVLNVVFFSIMLLFIYLQASSVHLMEEETAKQIALLIDVAKPGTTLEINLKDFFEKAEGNGIKRESSIVIDKEKNLVIVKGDEDSFFEYGYFNDKFDGENFDFSWGPDKDNDDYLELVFIKVEKEAEEKEVAENDEA